MPYHLLRVFVQLEKGDKGYEDKGKTETEDIRKKLTATLPILKVR